MSNYFSQFVPQLGNDRGKLKTLNVETSSGSSPHLKYISIFNPSLVNEKEESNEEFLKQILCFCTKDVGNQDQVSKIEQLKLIGLIRGVDSFARNFTKSNGLTNVIKSSNSSIILYNIEPGFYIACSISDTNGLVIQQLIKLLETAYQYFVMFHLRYKTIIEIYGPETIRDMLKEYWAGFLLSFNSQSYEIPPGFAWTHMTNYKGFLGLIPFPSKEPFVKTYKKSSLSLSQNAKNEIDLILNATSQLHRPQGLIISYFDKTTPKKYGALQIEAFEDSEGVGVDRSSLIDLYNWLEYYDYHAKLDTENLTRINSSSIFQTNLARPEVDFDEEVPSSEENDVSALKAATASALDILNPLNLTNNLVVSPLNYTVNSMLNLGEQVTTTIRGTGEQIAGDEEHQEHSNPKVESSWLSVPPMLKNLRLGALSDDGSSSALEANVNTEERDNEEEEEEQEEEINDHDDCEYLTGLKEDTNGEPVIHRKLVYLPFATTKNGEKKRDERECSLIVFKKKDIYITLVYESSNSELDNVDFYNSLSEELLIPASEEILNLISGGSVIGNSLGSLRSLNGLLQNPAAQLDSEFFFIVYDGSEGSLQTSLPYLPNITIPQSKLSATDKAVVKYQGAMFFLHEQLSSVFLMSQNKDFFSDTEMNEYFHKFTSNKTNDWMFYYIKHKGKYIIIIKNHNRSSKGSKRASVAAANIRRASTVAENETGSSVFHKITDGAYDYAQLGFLDNLGVDVKYWLESFSHSGET